MQGFLFRVVLLKKLTVLLIILTAILGGAWLALRFAPDAVSKLPFLQSKQREEQASTPTQATPSDYLSWRDSLDAIDLRVRTEQDPRILRALKDRQQYYWQKLQSARQSIPLPTPTPAASQDKPTTISVSDAGFVKFLSKVLTITAVVLVVLIGILLFFLKRRRDILTQHLEAIREDDRFQGARSGVLEMEPQRLVTKFPKNTRINSPNVIPDTRALDLGELAATLAAQQQAKTSAPTSTREGSPLRPTAKQRVTTALKGLAEALSALKEESGTTPGANKQEDTRAGAEKAKVRSPNMVRPTVANQVLAPTKFEKEQEEISDILKLARRGFTSSEIARRLRIPQDQVETVVRMHRESE